MVSTIRTSHLAFVVGALLSVPRDASADGERTPMFGVALVGAEAARTPNDSIALVGFGVDLAWWHGRFGLAAEASERWTMDFDARRATVAGVSARLRLVEGMMPSLIDPRDVELGLELQAIAERTWWTEQVALTAPAAYGFGLALRVRGGSDPDGSTHLAESRFFVRVMSSRFDDLRASGALGTLTAVNSIARMVTPVREPERALTVLVGIGASFGGGTPTYSRKFRLHPFDPSVIW